MKRNMGNADRAIRIIIAAIIATLYYRNIITGSLAYVLLAVAGIFVITSLFAICPLYTILGIRTCANGKKSKTV
ncbi:MAG: DUF2892 domain-containing protein [Bacteroidetes bacterium]|nr:DUF2892 domain-containing protein [Bacteroidota bacterium]MBS1610146.1 DUF2892 domain-containing protein [Bacteroidota bacterium]